MLQIDEVHVLYDTQKTQILSQINFDKMYSTNNAPNATKTNYEFEDKGPTTKNNNKIQMNKRLCAMSSFRGNGSRTQIRVIVKHTF